jgi:hypothetical protein
MLALRKTESGPAAGIGPIPNAWLYATNATIRDVNNQNLKSTVWPRDA